MDRGRILMDRFRSRLEPWLGKLHNTAKGHSNFTMEVFKDGSFTWTWRWPDQGTYSLHVSRQDVFGTTYELHPEAWQIKLEPCRCARQGITAMLQSRGIL